MARNATVRLDVEAAEGQAKVERLGGSLEELGIEAVEAGEKFESIEEAAVEMSQGVERSAEGAAQEVQAMGAKAQRAASQVQSMGKAGSSANQVLFNLGDITQDAQFGMAGVANNVPILIEQFGRLQTKAGGTGAAMSTLVKSLAGAGGLVLAVNAVMAVGPQLVGFLSDTEESASDTEEKMSSLFDTSEGGSEKIDNLGKSLEELDPSASTAAAAMRVVENGIRRATSEFRLLRTLLQQDEGLLNTLVQGLRQAVPGLGVAQAELKVAEVAETTDRLREVLSRTDRSARLARLALAALGADVDKIMGENVKEARAEVASLGDEINTVFGGRAKQLLDEAPEAVAEELQSSLAELQERLRTQQEQGLADQEEVLEQQISFLEDSLKQISNEFEDPQRFQAAFGPLLQRLQRLRAQLQNVLEDARQAQESVGGVQSILNRRQARQFLRRQRQRSPTGMGPRFGLPSQGQLQRGMMRSQRMSMQFGQAAADRRAMMGAQRAAEDLGFLGPNLVEEFDKLTKVQETSNQKLAQGIDLAAQLGATLSQAAQGAETEWNRVLGQIIQSIGSAVALSGNVVPGAAISGLGTLVGSFEHGGTASRTGLAEMHPPEIVTGVPGGAQIVGREETMQILEQSQGQDTVVTEIRRLGSRIESMDVRMDAFQAGTEIGHARQRLEEAGDAIYPTQG